MVFPGFAHESPLWQVHDARMVRPISLGQRDRNCGCLPVVQWGVAPLRNLGNAMSSLEQWPTRVDRLWQPVAGVTPLLGLVTPEGVATAARPKLLYRKGSALLGYLVMESGRRHRRSDLAHLFWPDLPASAGLTNLRQVLCDLHRKLLPILGPEVLQIERTHVQLQLTWGQAQVDLQVIEAVAIGEHSAQLPAMDWLLHCDELLAEWDVDGCPAFDQWLASQRRWYWQLWRRALERLRAVAEQGHDWRLALECVRCQIQVDPWDESLHRQRMQLYCALGQAELALASYQSLAQQLEKELGVLPDHDTAILAQCIQARVL